MKILMRLLLVLLLGLCTLTANAAYRSSTKAYGANDSGTITKPTGTVDGDRLIFAVENNGNTVTWPFTPASTYTFTTNGSVARGSSWIVAIKIASSEPSSYTITIGGGNGMSFPMVSAAFSGRSSSVTASQVTNEGGNGASPFNNVLAGITAATGDDICLIQGLSDGHLTNTWTVGLPGSYIDRQNQDSTGVFYGGTLDLATRDNVSSGSTGSLTSSFTMTGGIGDTGGLVIAFPASVSAGLDGSMFLLFP